MPYTDLSLINRFEFDRKLSSTEVACLLTDLEYGNVNLCDLCRNILKSSIEVGSPCYDCHYSPQNMADTAQVEVPPL